MKQRLLKLFSPKFTYTSEEVKIKSDVELNEEQVNEICNIITQTVKSSYYRRGYQIARMIVHKLGDPICFAECYFGKKRVFIKVSQYH